MGVKIKKRGGKWYVFVNYHGRRKAKCVGSSREVAEQVRRQLEAKLALGDLGMFEPEFQTSTFGDYATRWLRQHANLHCKPSTVRSYNGILDLYLLPRFKGVMLDRLGRDAIKNMFVELAEQDLSSGTLKNVLIVLRSLLNGAIEDKIITINPAAKLGRFIPKDDDQFEVSPLTQDELQKFLNAALRTCPDQHPLFLTLARTGMRVGEVVALKWGDIQFGEDEDDRNRFIFIRRNWVAKQFGKPKSGKERRVDLSRQLRRVLLDLRDRRSLKAYLAGQSSIADELVFPSEASTPLDGSNVYTRYFLPAVEAAGLRHFRIHDLRHTYASLLIQAGASLAYVRDQLGPSSIQVTVDLYGHLVPSANIGWVDGLDQSQAETTPEQNATPAQLETTEEEGKWARVIDNSGGPGRSRTADQRFRKPLLYPTELRGHKDLALFCLPPVSHPKQKTAVHSGRWSGNSKTLYRGSPQPASACVGVSKTPLLGIVDGGQRSGLAGSRPILDSYSPNSLAVSLERGHKNGHKQDQALAVPALALRFAPPVEPKGEKCRTGSKSTAYYCCPEWYQRLPPFRSTYLAVAQINGHL
jgi:integrase